MPSFEENYTHSHLSLNKENLTIQKFGGVLETAKS